MSIDSGRRTGWGIQLVFAGKTHPRNIPEKRILKEIYRYMKMLRSEIKIVLPQNYNMEIAARLMASVDV